MSLLRAGIQATVNGMASLISSTNKKYRSQRSSGKVMSTVFWDAQGIILSDFSEPGAIANSECYFKTLIKLKARIGHTRSEKKKTLFSQHNNARPHASLKTTECVTKFDWTVLSHPPYSPGLTPSDFYLFESLKEEFRPQHFVDNNAVIDAV